MSALDPRAVVAADVWPPTLGCDPGGSHTGLCLRLGTAALEGVTVDRADSEPETDHVATPAYALRVLDTMAQLVERNGAAIAEDAGRRGVRAPSVRIAVETLVPPSPRREKGKAGVGISHRVLMALPATAQVLGAVLGRHPSAILVRPHAGGSRGWDELDKDSYPPSLHGRTPPGWLPGGSERRHQRSAWAIAGAGHLLAPAALDRAALPTAAPPAPARPAHQAGGTNLVPAAVATPGDADTAAPTPERRTALRLTVTRQVVRGGGTLHDLPGLIVHLRDAALDAAADAAERRWLLGRLPQLAAATVPDLLPGEPPEQLRNVAALVRLEVETLLERSAA